MHRGSAVIAVDVGGTHIKGAVLMASGERLFLNSEPTPESENVSAIINFVGSLQTRAAGAGIEVIAVGIVTPGMVDEVTGVIAYASNLGWRDLPLAEIVERDVKLPVYVSHDVRSAGKAERALGAARGVSDLFFLTIGTGIAAAIISDRRPISGALSAAGEFGHIPVAADGELCTCGQRGCLEVYVSGAGIARRYAARGGLQLTTQQIVQKIDSDQLAGQIWDEGMRALAQGLAIVTLLLDPSKIVIGGGFAASGDAMLKPLTTYLERSLMWRPVPDVLVSEVGSDAGVLGSGIFAFERSGYSHITGGWLL